MLFEKLSEIVNTKDFTKFMFNSTIDKCSIKLKTLLPECNIKTHYLPKEKVIEFWIFNKKSTGVVFEIDQNNKKFNIYNIDTDFLKEE